MSFRKILSAGEGFEWQAPRNAVKNTRKTKAQLIEKVEALQREVARQKRGAGGKGVGAANSLLESEEFFPDLLRPFADGSFRARPQGRFSSKIRSL